MRVKPPGDGVPAAPGVDEAAAPDPTAPAGEVVEARGAGAVGAVEAVTGTAAAGGVDHVAQVARRLRAGDITVDQAVEELIDEVVARHAAGPAARDSIAADLKELLRRQIANDPYLASKVRRMGNSS